MKVLIIAGHGKFPVEVAKGAKKRGYDPLVVVLKDYAREEDFEGLADRIFEFSLLDLPQLLSLIRAERPCYTVLAGKVPHKVVFTDLLARPSLLPYAMRLKGKSSEDILREVIRIIEEAGTKVIDSSLFVKHLLVPEGLLIGDPLREKERAEISRAFKICKKIAEMDIGLAIAYKEGAVVAVEALEGTDEMIRRAGRLTGGDFMVIKVARPFQDMRFDLPAVGEDTLKVMVESGANMLVVEANMTLFFDFEKASEIAKKNKVRILSWKE